MESSNECGVPAGPVLTRAVPTRRGLVAAMVVVLGVGAAACGSDAPAALSSDDLASEADAICRTTTRAIEKGDIDDPESYLEDAIEELETASDDLELLVPGADVRDDFDDFTSVVSKQVRQAKKVLTAVQGGDATKLSSELAAFGELSVESDDLADGLDASRCVGLGQAAMAGVAGAGVTTTSIPDTTVPPTVETTLPPTTAAPVTLPPITTAPPTTAPPVTSPPVTSPPATDPPSTDPPGGMADGNLIDDWVAPPGFEFQRESGDIFVKIFPSPRADPTLAPAYVRYDVGALGGPSATTFPIMMVLELNTAFEGALIEAYISFEGNDAGSLVDSPGGLKMWVTPAAGDLTFDATMVFIGRYAVTIRTEPGVDALSLLDAFVDANFE
jgi:hypothetical protein